MITSLPELLSIMEMLSPVTIFPLLRHNKTNGYSLMIRLLVCLALQAFKQSALEVFLLHFKTISNGKKNKVVKVLIY
jgi:hypothetical protein